jgi:hypothetical protein
MTFLLSKTIITKPFPNEKEQAIKNIDKKDSIFQLL